MPERIEYTAAFEDQVKAALDVPEPSPLFMDSLRSQFLAGAHLTHKETKMKPLFSRMAWGFAFLILLVLILTAFSSPSVVNALRRLLQYIPGVGVVEESTSLRVLAAPVTLSRDGVTLTIEQVATQPDKTTIIYQYLLDSTIIDRTPAPNADTLPSFAKAPSLRLPDGSQMKIKLGQHLAGTISDADAAAGKSAVRYRMEFAPLPGGIVHIVLLLPRLIPIAPGAGPEFWEIPLDLGPSTGVDTPVIEVEPTETEQSSVSPLASSAVSTPVAPANTHPEALFVLDKVVPVADGYILIGYTVWNLPAPVPGAVGYGLDPADPIVTDANGQVFDWYNVTPERTDIPERKPWAYHLTGKNIQWPLTITTKAMMGDLNLGISHDAPPPPTFTFDPGKNPQIGQSWALDKDFTIAGYSAHISSVRLLTDPDTQKNYYEFTIHSSNGMTDLFWVDLDNLDHSSRGPGQINFSDTGLFTPKLTYDVGQPLAPGPIRVLVDDISVYFAGNWQVSWSPPGQ